MYFFLSFAILLIGCAVATTMILREEWNTTRRKIVFAIGLTTILMVLACVGYWCGLYLGVYLRWSGYL